MALFRWRFEAIPKSQVSNDGERLMGVSCCRRLLVIGPERSNVANSRPDEVSVALALDVIGKGIKIVTMLYRDAAARHDIPSSPPGRPEIGSPSS